MNNPLKKIGESIVPPDSLIHINDPTLFNTCLAATAECEIRAYLNYLHIDLTNKILAGSNGHMLVFGKALGFDDYQSRGNILIKPAKKLPKNILYAVINIKTKLIEGVSKKKRFSIPFETSDLKYPNLYKINISDENRIAEAKISFQPHYLTLLQKASQSTQVIITTHRQESINQNALAINLVDGEIKSDYTAIIMPVNL